VSAGGHGTHVAGIAAGYEVTTTSPAGTRLRGAAPGAKLVGLSVGASTGLIDAAAAMYWVLEHQNRPCRPKNQQDGAPEPQCPPIRVTNHSYGPATENDQSTVFDERSAEVSLQRALIGKGVTPVWAAGNAGGDGGVAQTNPPAMDPDPAWSWWRELRRRGQRQSRQPALGASPPAARPASPAPTRPVRARRQAITSSCRPQLTICSWRPSFDGGNYQTISGTSMATPYVAGVVAQLAQLKPRSARGRARRCSRTPRTGSRSAPPTRTDPRNPSHPTSVDKGHGLVDVLSALSLVRGQVGSGQPQVRSLDSACPPGPGAGQQPDRRQRQHPRAGHRVHGLVGDRAWHLASDYDPGGRGHA
jgi:serine protease AprX